MLMINSGAEKRAGWLQIGLLLVLCGITAGKAGAAELIDPFEGLVEVSSRSTSERQRLLPQALYQVFLKISGNSQLAETLASQIDVQTASSLVQQFSYEDNPALEFDDSRPESVLRVRFQRQGVMDLVSRADLPVWPFERRIIVPWIALDDGQQRQLAGLSEYADDLNRAIQHVAAERGMPVLVPLLDLDDQRAITTTDIWGGFLEPLQQATQRYGDHDAVSVALFQSGSEWQARWAMKIGNSPQRWRSFGATAEQALIEGVKSLAERQGDRLAVSGDVEVFNIAISGVRSAQALGDLVAFFEAMSVVESVDPVAVDGQTIELRLNARGGQQAFSQLLKAEAWLQPVSIFGAGLAYEYLR